jgi:tetratricopeptide (TPR) repeat protein
MISTCTLLVTQMEFAMKQCVVFLSLVLFVPQDLRLAEVSGEVRDMQGRPIAEASVVYSRVSNNRTYRLKTDKNGRYYAIGLLLGWYNLEITGPTGKRIYSGKKFLQTGDSQKFNVTQIDLSSVAPKASLVPFKGPRAEELQNGRARTMVEGKKLSPAELAELRNDNSLISRYNELLPSTQAAIKDEDWSRAAELLRQLIEIAPYKWELYQNLGVIQRRLTRFQDAVVTLEKGIQIVQIEPNLKHDPLKLHAGVVLMRIEEGEADLAMNNVEAAASQFRTATQLDPKSTLAYLHLCTAEYNNGHPDESLSACAHAIALEPQHSENYQVMAGVQDNLDLHLDALATYKKGTAVALDNMRAARPSPKSNINSKRYSDPSHAFTEGVRAGQMMQSAGNIHFQLKNYAEAAELFTQSSRLHPYPALPLFNLCATLFDMGRLPAASDACDRAIDADPKMPDSYYVKAAAMAGEAAKNGKLKPSHQTAATLEKYLKLAPDGFYANDARALLKQMGDTE